MLACAGVAHATAPGRPCIETRPAQPYPRDGAVDVPRNAVFVSLSGYPGLYHLTGGDYAETIRVAKVDPLRGVLFRAPLMPPSTVMTLSYGDEVLARFTTADTTDPEPPRAPQIISVTATEGIPSLLQVRVASSLDTRVLSMRIENRTSHRTLEALFPPDGWSVEQDPNCPGTDFAANDELCVQVAAIDDAGHRSVYEPTTCVRVSPRIDRFHDGAPTTRDVGPLLISAMIGLVLYVGSLLLGFRFRTTDRRGAFALVICGLAGACMAAAIATLDVTSWECTAPLMFLPVSLAIAWGGQRSLAAIARENAKLPRARVNRD